MDMTPQEAEKQRRMGYLELMRSNDGHYLHGTTTGYGYGCRCDRCRAANKAARERREARRAMPFSYNFPKHADAGRETLQQAMSKVSEESHELMFAVLDGEGEDSVIEEALDTMHACETLLRRYPAKRVKAARDAVIEKNRKRGYYGEGR